MCINNEQVLHGVVVACGHAADALAAAMLVAEGVGGDSLDVSALAEGNDYLFVGFEFFAGEV